jgi:hypothetical protein
MDDEELRDLQERVQVIMDMTSSPGWALLMDAARAALIAKQTRILQGKCETHEEYMAECAFGDGVEYLIGLPNRLQRSLDREHALREEEREEEYEEMEEFGEDEVG